MRKQGLCAHKIWPLFRKSNFNNFINKYDLDCEHKSWNNYMMNRKSDTDKYYLHTIYYKYIELTFAPLESKNFTTSVCPPLSALSSGVSSPYKHNQ